MRKLNSRITALIVSILMLAGVCMPRAAAEDTAPAEEEAFIAGSQDEFDELVRGFMDDYSLYENNLAVGFVYTATGEEYYYNPDYYLYSASLYKVPLVMSVEKRALAGELDRNERVAGYSLDWLEEQTLVYSNNNTAHWLLNYYWPTIWEARASWPGLAGMTAEELDPDFVNLCRFNAVFMTRLMLELYNNPDSYPGVLDYLRRAEPEHWFRSRLEGKYDIAQKYGAYELVKHTSGIIYTDNPIILTVLTWYCPDSDERIGDLAERFVNYAGVLDERVQAHEDELERQRREEEERLKREAEVAAEAERAAAEEAARLAAEEEAARIAAEKAAAAAVLRKKMLTAAFVIIVAAAAALTAVLVPSKKKKKNKQ